VINPRGTTPLDPDEAEALLPGHITTRGELDTWENQNILQATKWLARRRGGVLTDAFVCRLHRRMFDETWSWAGRYRLSDKNTGAHWPQIPSAVRDLCEDARVWFANAVFPARQAAARLHHCLVAIHCFPDGNGRHARLYTDTVLASVGEPPFGWGHADLHVSGSVRDAYLSALRTADGGDYRELFKFLGCA
jgi:Fic-DOC domain mobile mystery protein B